MLMDTYFADEISMWSAVEESRRQIAISQLRLLSEIMDGRFYGVLFRNTLDYIFYRALFPAGGDLRYMKSKFHSLLPRTEKAHQILQKKSFSSVRSDLKLEHITSVYTLSNYFIDRKFESVLENFNICIIINEEYTDLGKGCGIERYIDRKIKIVVPSFAMIKPDRLKIDSCAPV